MIKNIHDRKYSFKFKKSNLKKKIEKVTFVEFSIFIKNLNNNRYFSHNENVSIMFHKKWTSYSVPKIETS